MKIINSIILFIGLSLSLTASEKPLRLWYTSPAAYWEESLPLGNGRLGAMPDGGIFKETVVLNDITLWSGAPQDADNTDAHKHLKEIQQLLFDGKNIEAQEIMGKYFICKGKGSGEGNSADLPYGSYQVLGNLHLTYSFGSSSDATPENYERELSLDEAVAKTRFSIDGTSYTREYFTSFDNDVIVIRLSADRLKSINFRLSLDRPERYETKVLNGQLVMTGQLNNGTDGKGMRYITTVHVKPDGGRFVSGDKTLEVKEANSAIIYISANTDYKHPDYLLNNKSTLKQALTKKYETEKAAHIKTYQALFQRAKVTLEGADKSDLPTDKRIQAFRNDPTDNGMPVLYFQYGRYLLISSTRPNLLPPNLQGLWANTIRTPWNGDYHLNINLQMNHWLVHPTNLGILNEPFFDLVNNMISSGEKTAKAYYNANGWVAHVLNNVWGYTSPGEHYSWGSYNTGSGWLCQMLWDHYEYTNDISYLKRLYPILKGSARFYLSLMVKDPKTGWLVTSPSNSPENPFYLPDGRVAHVCMGPTIDSQIVRYLWNITIEACEKLGVDSELKEQLQHKIGQLAPNRVGSDGRLMEWLEEYKDAEPAHRHTSHLWALHPGKEISLDTPDLAEAARKTLYARGNEGTGWSFAWKINFWARLQDGERAFYFLKSLLRPVKDQSTNMANGGGTYNNLFCAHPPFQIDGNFGGTSGISEMLLQSQNGYIELIPALPAHWKDGDFSGLCVRGGGEVSATWSNSRIQTVNIKATVDNVFRIKIPSYVESVENEKGQVITPDDKLLIIKLSKGEETSVRFR